MLQGPGVTLALVMAAVAATVTVTAGQVVIAQETSAVTQRALFKRLTSKLQLLEKLLQGSSLAKRIERSGNSQAEALLATARKSLVQSEEELYAGQYEAAEAAANQGLNAVTTASRMVVDRRYEEAGDRERYQQLRKRVLSFTEAFQRVVIEKQGQDIDGLLDQKKVGELLLDAEGLVQKGNYAMANQRMTEAADAVEHALSRARDKETLLHELKFDTPVDEYNYEKQRNKSYELLVDILEKERKGKGLEDVRAAIELNRRRRAEADELVDGGDVVAAIRTLEEGTENLARALRRSGLAF
jgi:hypothetical protein